MVSGNSVFWLCSIPLGGSSVDLVPREGSSYVPGLGLAAGIADFNLVNIIAYYSMLCHRISYYFASGWH